MIQQGRRRRGLYHHQQLDSRYHHSAIGWGTPLFNRWGKVLTIGPPDSAATPEKTRSTYRYSGNTEVLSSGNRTAGPTRRYPWGYNDWSRHTSPTPLNSFWRGRRAFVGKLLSKVLYEKYRVFFGGGGEFLISFYQKSLSPPWEVPSLVFYLKSPSHPFLWEGVFLASFYPKHLSPPWEVPS